jgi:hypothetical protein
MNLTDYQVLSLIRAHPGSSQYQLCCLAKKEMGKWHWSIGKIQMSVRRLTSIGKVETELTVKGGRARVNVRLSKI